MGLIRWGHTSLGERKNEEGDEGERRLAKLKEVFLRRSEYGSVAKGVDGDLPFPSCLRLWEDVSSGSGVCVF